MTQPAEDPAAERANPGAVTPEPSAASAPAAQPQPQPQPQPQQPQHVVTSTRTGAVWAAAVGFAVVLLLLLIFILQNSQRVVVSFYGIHGHLPLGVALLLAAVFGVLLVVIPGIGRMAQLRLTARRHRKGDQAAGAPPQAPGPGAPR
jgi:uncharacterized integral membrane protein